MLCSSGVHFKVKSEADEAMHSSCVMPTVQAFKGSVMIWGCFSLSGLGSAMLCGNKMKSAEYLNVLNDQVISSSANVLGEFEYRNGHSICAHRFHYISSNCSRLIES